MQLQVPRQLTRAVPRALMSKRLQPRTSLSWSAPKLRLTRRGRRGESNLSAHSTKVSVRPDNHSGQRARRTRSGSAHSTRSAARAGAPAASRRRRRPPPPPSPGLSRRKTSIAAVQILPSSAARAVRVGLRQSPSNRSAQRSAGRSQRSAGEPIARLIAGIRRASAMLGGPQRHFVDRPQAFPPVNWKKNVGAKEICRKRKFGQACGGRVREG